MINPEDDLVRAVAATYDTPLYVFREKVIRNKCREVRRALSYALYEDPACVKGSNDMRGTPICQGSISPEEAPVDREE